MNALPGLVPRGGDTALQKRTFKGPLVLLQPASKHGGRSANSRVLAAFDPPAFKCLLEQKLRACLRCHNTRPPQHDTQRV